MKHTAQAAVAVAERARKRWIDGQQRVVAVIDVSGSAPQDMTQTWADYLSDIVGVEVLTINDQVRPYVPGSRIRSEGPSYFHVLVEYIERVGAQPDRVIVFTDGAFEPITPQNPEMWKWVIVSDYRSDAERNLATMETLYAD
jgi:predicted metal-dependent peptidase